jgi:hypothetical protein
LRSYFNYFLSRIFKSLMENKGHYKKFQRWYFVSSLLQLARTLLESGIILMVENFKKVYWSWDSFHFKLFAAPLALREDLILFQLHSESSLGPLHPKRHCALSVYPPILFYCAHYMRVLMLYFCSAIFIPTFSTNEIVGR